jgi:AcrR family transcriptional regulator
VAERAGVAVGSVYRHFPTKADLVVHVFREVVTREVDAVRAASAAPGEPAERVLAVFETFAQRALKAPRQAYALLAEPVDALIDAERLEFRRAFTEVVAEHVAAGVRAGTLPPQDGRVTAAALVGAAAEVLIGPLTSGNPGDVSELRTFVVRALGGSDARHA